MTEKEMFILVEVILEGVSDVKKSNRQSSNPRHITNLKRIRKAAEDYEKAKVAVENPPSPKVRPAVWG